MESERMLDRWRASGTRGRARSPARHPPRVLRCAAVPSWLTLISIALAAPAEPLTRYEFVAPQMGTVFRLVFYAACETEAQSAAAAAFARVAEVNRIASDYNPESELSRLVRQPAGKPVALSAELFDLLQRGQELARFTDGAFDVTTGPIVQLWREARRTRRLPSESERATALRISGHHKLQLNATARTATLRAPGMHLDLGGIAKGHAADQALAVLARRGVTRALVAASGDLAIGDAPPGASGWRIEIAPFGERGPEPIVLVATHVGVSTSGDAGQFVEIGGVRYSHIVNPATAVGLTQRVAVTVVARSATLSDSWATACSVLAAAEPGKKIDRVIGESTRVLVFRHEGAERPRETYGENPPGLQTQL